MTDQDTIQRHSAHASIWQLVLAFVAGVLAALPAVYSYLSFRLEDRLVARIEPYEHFLYGSEMEYSGLYDDATQEFDRGFEALTSGSDRSVTPARISSYLGRYLLCLAFSTNPTTHRAQFERCRELFSKHLVTETSENLRYEGWFLLVTGVQDEAKKYFDAALQQGSLENSHESVGWANYALAMHALTIGDSSAAYKYNDLALANLPAEKLYYYDTEPTCAELAKLYPKFGEALVELQERFGKSQQEFDKKMSGKK